MKNTLDKIFIIMGYILQLLWDFFMIVIFSTLAFKKWGAYANIDGLKFSFEIQDICHIVIVTLIFIVFAFLPYGLTKCLYWWYYEERNISERWIIPSKIISFITIVMYIIGIIIDFFNI